MGGDHDRAADARGRERDGAMDLLPRELENETRREDAAEAGPARAEHHHGTAGGEPVQHAQSRAASPPSASARQSAAIASGTYQRRLFAARPARAKRLALTMGIDTSVLSSARAVRRAQRADQGVVMIRTSLRVAEQGFTLLEIMVVVVIIGLLAAMMVPNLKGTIDKAQIRRATSDLRGIET